jgi:hypothetical protein
MLSRSVARAGLGLPMAADLALYRTLPLRLRQRRLRTKLTEA